MSVAHECVQLQEDAPSRLFFSSNILVNIFEGPFQIFTSILHDFI